jgi:hypothetical protein
MAFFILRVEVIHQANSRIWIGTVYATQIWGLKFSKLEIESQSEFPFSCLRDL